MSRRKELVLQIFNAAHELDRQPDDLPTLRKKLEEAQAELRKFWEAKDRPWFCRNDTWGNRYRDEECGGLLRPETQYGFACTKCGATYLLNRETANGAP